MQNSREFLRENIRLQRDVLWWGCFRRCPQPPWRTLSGSSARGNFAGWRHLKGSAISHLQEWPSLQAEQRRVSSELWNPSLWGAQEPGNTLEEGVLNSRRAWQAAAGQLQELAPCSKRTKIADFSQSWGCITRGPVISLEEVEWIMVIRKEATNSLLLPGNLVSSCSQGTNEFIRTPAHRGSTHLPALLRTSPRGEREQMWLMGPPQGTCWMASKPAGTTEPISVTGLREPRDRKKCSWLSYSGLL